MLAGVSSAATTIGTNITTQGTLAVTGASTLTGATTITGLLTTNGDITLSNGATAVNTSADLLTITEASITLAATATTTASGDIYVTKSIKVGNGTPTVTLNGEDVYIEGTLEVDGAVRFDSTLEVNNTITLKSNDTIKNDTASTTIMSGILQLTGDLDVNGTASSSIAGDLYVTKAFKVGDGTPDLGLNLEDAYIEGSLEVDGAVRFDGTVTANGLIIDSAGILEQTADITSDLTASELGNHILVFQDTVDDAITLTFGGDILADVIPDGGSVEYIFINESGGIITIGADQNATILSTDKTIADNEFARITVFRIGALYWVFMNVPVALDAGDVT